ncbi:MAG TPA: T9SS type A sorting domain-containing protein [Bacteroidia bacterium]|jgi:DNA-binding beta-propeller fold protein YncE|nr:T9SS type A sorting domain-containing protein [Bacteroidia bacterium]
MKTNILITAVLIGAASFVKAQDIIDSYLKSSPVYTTIGSSTNKVAAPRDLDFKPGTDELWVLNNGTSSVPGSATVTFYNAGKSNQASRWRRDSNSGHFLRMGSAIAFGENGLWANSNESDNGGDNFMGPALWPSDCTIYAKVHQNDNMLGSHCDMLHQSPWAMGIAHESGNIFWIFDGNKPSSTLANTICKYDFAKPHEYGGDDHSDGLIWRYTDVKVMRVANVPSHMIIDKKTGMLYIADTGNKRILKLDTKSGTIGTTISQSSEKIAGYKKVTGATVTTFASEGLVQPCGIDFYEGRLIVTDHSTGEIIIYDANTSAELGRIKTGSKGIMGVKVGPDGKIWYVDNAANKVIRLDPGIPTGIQKIASSDAMHLYPNPSSGDFSLQCTLNTHAPVTIHITDNAGRVIEAIQKEGQAGDNLFEFSGHNYAPGVYLISLSNGTESYFKKLIIL